MAVRRIKTARGAARVSGLSAGYISRVMRKLKDPRLSTARLIAASMGISIARLVELIDEGAHKVVDPGLSKKISDGVKFRNSVKRFVEEGHK